MTRTFIREGHGRGRGTPHVEGPVRDELPDGVPAPPAEEPVPIERTADGKIAGPEAAKELGRRGGLARAEQRAQEAALGALLRFGEGDLFTPRQSVRSFAKVAQRLYRTKVEELARDIGGGQVSAGVTTLVRQWAHAATASLYAFELLSGPAGGIVGADGKPSTKTTAELATVATRLSSEARQLLLCAHSLAATEATARRERDRHTADPLAAWRVPATSSEPEITTAEKKGDPSP